MLQPPSLLVALSRCRVAPPPRRLLQLVPLSLVFVLVPLPVLVPLCALQVGREGLRRVLLDSRSELVLLPRLVLQQLLLPGCPGCVLIFVVDALLLFLLLLQDLQV